MTTKKAKNNWNIKIWRGARHAPMSPKGSFFCGFNNGIDSIEWTYVLFATLWVQQTLPNRWVFSPCSSAAVVTLQKCDQLHLDHLNDFIWFNMTQYYFMIWTYLKFIWTSWWGWDRLVCECACSKDRVCFSSRLDLWCWKGGGAECAGNLFPICGLSEPLLRLSTSREKEKTRSWCCLCFCMFLLISHRGPRAVHAASTVAAAGGTTPRIMIIRIY